MAKVNTQSNTETGEILYNDKILGEKTVSFSAAFYNLGLNCAQSGDLSGAVTALNKALEFNKRNIDARNLLGLCCYAAGKIGDALNHWIISLAYEKEGNPASDYLNELQDNTKQFEKLSDSIKLYNQALGYLKQGNEDMALIRLKRCVELNPAFVDAFNLLTICHMLVNDPSHALQASKKALEIDSGNENALRYYAKISSEIQKLSGRKKEKKDFGEAELPARLKSSDKKHFTNNLPVSEIASFVIGALIMCAFFYFLIMPGVSKDRDKQITALKETITSDSTGHAAKLAETGVLIDELREESVKKDEKIDELQVAAELQERIRLVYAASNFFYQDKLEEAFNLAQGINGDGFPADIRELWENTAHEAGTKLESQLYTKGLSDYNNSRWDQAKQNFESAMVYSQKDSKYIDLMLYYLGRIAERQNDPDTARNYYERLINDYPGSSQVRNAQTRLNGLN